jgi:hypothetical protein
MEKWKKSKSSLTSTHLSATPTAGTPPPATTSRAVGPPHPKLAASRPPALATPRPHRAIPHSPSHGRYPAPSPRRPELVAPCRLDITARSSSPRAAPSSSPAGKEWGRGGDPPKMGQGTRSAGDGPGEEILRRWGKGRIAAGRQGCSEVEVRWLATGRRRQHLLFYFFIGLTSGPLSKSAQIEFSLPAQHLQVGPIYQIWCQFASNSRSVWIEKNYPKSHGFLWLKCKVVVFRNFAFNVVVLCYLPTRRLTLSTEVSRPLPCHSYKWVLLVEIAVNRL